MAESSKSVAEIQQVISEHAQEVNETIAKTKVNLGTLTNDMIQKDSAIIHLAEVQSKKVIQDVQDNNAEKEKKIRDLMKSGRKYFANQYEQILQENVSKLKQIAQEDFNTSNDNAKRLIEDTKSKLHSFITEAFDDNDSKKDFVETTGAILSAINDKIKEDITSESKSNERAASLLSPDMAGVFVLSMDKSPEEIQAERLLQKLFEDELLEFNEQITKNFQDINERMSKVVEDTKEKVNETIQSMAGTELCRVESSEATNAKSFSNLPSKSTVEQNVNILLNKAGNDFQLVKEDLDRDVNRQKQKIEDDVKYYAEKMLGKQFMGSEEIDE